MKKFKLIVSTMLFLTIATVAQDATQKSVTKLYIATFNRAPDKAGLDYWVDVSKFSLENIAMSFFDQPETKEKYPTGYSTVDFINAIYSNLFKRTPDQKGGDYWQKELDSGSFSKSLFILAVLNGAKDGDADILENKTEVGLAFINGGFSNVDNAKDIMKDITSDKSTVTTALNTIKTYSKTSDTELPTIDTTPTTEKPTTTPTTQTKGEKEEKDDLPTF